MAKIDVIMDNIDSLQTSMFNVGQEIKELKQSMDDVNKRFEKLEKRVLYLEQLAYTNSLY